MGNKNKKAQQPAAAPKQEQKKTQTPPPAPKKESVETAVETAVKETPKNGTQQMINKIIGSGLDANRTMDGLIFINNKFANPEAAAKRYHTSVQTAEEIDRFTTIGVVALLAQEVVAGNTEWAMRMKKSEFEALVAISNDLGIDINMKLLPPSPESETVVLPATAVTVEKEVEKKIKDELKVQKKNIDTQDPTKIKDETELKEALLSIITRGSSLYSNFHDAVNFYRAYLQINHKEEADKMSDIELLEAITEIVDKCPFIVNGFGNFMHTLTSTYKNPTAAFCLFRNTAKNKTTGLTELPESEIAAIVHIVVTWVAKNKIAESERIIASCEKDLEVLKKDEKKNAKAIEDVNGKITRETNMIESYNAVIENTYNPSSDLADNFINLYKEKDKDAIRLFGYLVKSYYPDVDLKKVNQKDVLNNLQIHIGLITNLFLDPGAQILKYNESDLVELTETESSSEKEPEETADDSKKD